MALCVKGTVSSAVASPVTVAPAEAERVALAFAVASAFTVAGTSPGAEGLAGGTRPQGICGGGSPKEIRRVPISS